MIMDGKITTIITPDVLTHLSQLLPTTQQFKKCPPDLGDLTVVQELCLLQGPGVIEMHLNLVEDNRCPLQV